MQINLNLSKENKFDIRFFVAKMHNYMIFITSILFSMVKFTRDSIFVSLHILKIQCLLVIDISMQTYPFISEIKQ